MAFYYNSTTNAFYDTDIFPVANLPANSVAVDENTYKNLMAHQNNGGFIAHDNSGNPLVGSWMTTAATDMVHSSKVPDANTLGHVKPGSTGTISIANDGGVNVAQSSISSTYIAALAVTEGKIAGSAVTTDKIAVGAVTETELAAGAVTTSILADDAVTTDKILDGSVTEEKLDSVKDLEADETTLTMTEGSSEFTLSVKAGGITDTELAANAVTTAKIGNGAVTKDKLDSSVIPSVLSFNVHNGMMSWGPSENYFIIADLPADAGMIFDFTLRFYAEVQNAAASDEWCADFVVKTGVTYAGSVENARRRFWFKDGDRQSMRFTFNGLGSNNIYIAVERQSVHPSNDPADLDMNGEIDISGIKIFGN